MPPDTRRPLVGPTFDATAPRRRWSLPRRRSRRAYFDLAASGWTCERAEGRLQTGTEGSNDRDMITSAGRRLPRHKLSSISADNDRSSEATRAGEACRRNGPNNGKKSGCCDGAGARGISVARADFPGSTSPPRAHRKRRRDQLSSRAGAGHSRARYREKAVSMAQCLSVDEASRCLSTRSNALLIVCRSHLTMPSRGAGKRTLKGGTGAAWRWISVRGACTVVGELAAE